MQNTLAMSALRLTKIFTNHGARQASEPDDVRSALAFLPTVREAPGARISSQIKYKVIGKQQR